MRLDSAVENEIAVPKDWGFGEAKTGTEFFWMEFVFPELIANSNDSTAQVTIIKKWYLTDKTMEYFLRDMAILGWYGTDMAELDKSDPKSVSFYNQKVLITTEMESYTPPEGGQPKMIAKVKFINDPNRSPLKPMEKSAVRNLSAKVRGKIAAYRKKNEPPAVTKMREVFADHEPA